MKIVEYAADGLAVADTLAEETARNFLYSEDTFIKVSTDNFITAVRCLIHEGFPHTEVEFLFQDLHMKPDANGRLSHWAVGFCDTTEILLSRLLKLRPRHS